MSDREDVFCPECGANIGPGTFETIGCPLCGASDNYDDDCEDDEDS